MKEAIGTRHGRAVLRPCWSGLLLSLWAFSAPAAISVKDEWLAGGSVTIQSETWRAEFQAAEGAMKISYGAQSLRVTPFGAGRTAAGKTAACVIGKLEAEQVVVNATFGEGGGQARMTFILKEDGMVEVRPGEGAVGIQVQGPIRYGMLPGIFLEDVVYDPLEYEGAAKIHVPSENIVLGLLDGGNGILACAWPEGGQKVRLLVAGGNTGERLVDAVELTLDGKSAFFTVLTAPGIWRRQELTPSFLERDVQLPWKRPFAAKWKTELLESEVKTTFLFADRKDSNWRPMLGFYVHPVWFDGDKAMMRLTKKIPPEGSAFIYPLDGHKNAVLEFMRRTPAATILAKIREREAYPTGPRNAPDVGFTHCWGTALIKRSIYQYGFQKRELDFMKMHVDYCLDYVASIQTRNKQFHSFIVKMRGTLEEWKKGAPGNTQVIEFLDEMAAYLNRAEEGYLARVEWEGRKTPDEHIAYAEKLGDRLKALAGEEGTEWYAECMDILSAFNRLSAAQDEGIPAGFGTVMRDCFRAAGNGCANRPDAVGYAQKIRKAIREKLKCRRWETTGI